MELKGVRAADGGARLLLTVEKSEDGSVRQEHFAVLLSRIGEIPPLGEISEGTYARFLHESAVCEAVSRALRMLGAAGTSRRALALKLCRRGVAQSVAVEAVRELAARGLIDEVRGAEGEVRKGISKLWGDRRILADLRAKGYGTAALEEAARLLSAEREEARLAALLAKKSIPTDGQARARLVASLARYGYEIAMIERLLGDDM